MEKLPRVSASKIQLYRYCARKYKYKYIDKLEGESSASIYSQFGTALHKAIEKKYELGSDPKEVFEAKFTDQIEKWQNEGMNIIGGNQITDYQKNGRAILKRMEKNNEWDRFNPIELELRFYLPFPNIDAPICYLEGIIDMVNLDGTIIDHKSNAGRVPSATELANNPQFIIYNWAYQQLYGIPSNGIFWHHLRTGKLYEARVQDNYYFKLGNLEEDIRSILESNYFARKEYASDCKQCSFFNNCYEEKEEGEDERGIL